MGDTYMSLYYDTTYKQSRRGYLNSIGYNNTLMTNRWTLTDERTNNKLIFMKLQY